MTSANGSKHAMSRFTNSCLSTPRNPETQLPVDTFERSRTPQLFTASPTVRVEKCTQSLSLSQSPPIQQVHSARAEVHKTIPPQRPHTAPQTGTGAIDVQSSSGVEDLGHLDYSTLFSTLMESNALLRDEIQQLQEEHRERLHQVHQSSLYSSEIDNLEEEGNVRPRTIGRQDRHPVHAHVQVQNESLSRSLPPKLLRDTWVGPEESLDHGGTQEEHFSVHKRTSLSPSSRNATTSTSSHHSSNSSIHTPAGSDHEISGEEVQVREEDGSNQSGCSGESDSYSSSAHELPATGTHSPSESLASAQSSCQSHGRGEEGNPFASPGLLAIEKMWDDFSVEEYAPYEPDREDPKKSRDWSPRITVPEPFSMTVRESRTPKTKSRSMLIAERERMEREALEEAELKKKIHPTPVPASTYLPLYDLINAKSERRREQVKSLTEEILKSTERPFSFMTREEKKKQGKAEALRQSWELERAKSEQKRVFKAKPVPKHLFDPQISEQVREEEEYRKIRIRMRAEELMASSKLPTNMQVKGREYTIGSLRRKRLEEKQNRAFVTQEHQFHPSINDEVPDFDQAYLEFQKQLATRKQSKQTTTTEPFYLRSQLIPSRRQQIEQDLNQDEAVLPETRWPFVAPRTKVSRKSPKHSRISRSSSAPYPAQMTETAKVRQSLTRERLADLAEKETIEEQQRREKRRRERDLQRAVSEKSLSHDPTAWLEERKRQRLQHFRWQEKERQEKYFQQLEQMRQRVEARPLLFEQASLTAARQSAEAKYLAALKKAGLSEEEIQALNQQTAT